MSQIYDVADSYVERMAAQNPLLATALGVPGYDGGMADFSPDGAAEVASINRDTLVQLAAAPVEGERDRVAAEVQIRDVGVVLQNVDEELGPDDPDPVPREPEPRELALVARELLRDRSDPVVPELVVLELQRGQQWPPPGECMHGFVRQ